MKINNKWLLQRIFNLKGNFADAIIPTNKTFQDITIAPFKNAAKAAVCISADFEIGWAWRELGVKDRDERGTRERNNFSYILKLLEDYSIPITWATVGHLFIENCRKINGQSPHPKMPRPHRNDRWKGDWYMHDPCTDYHRDPLWYAPDLIQQIIDNKIPHEVGTHSFSHIDFSKEYSSNELVRHEIEECVTVMEPFNRKPRSLVFPFNKMGYSYLGLLSELGIVAVRHRDNKVRLSYPERTPSGVYKIYESMNLRAPKYYKYIDKAKIYIDEAVKLHAVYHLWFHPSDSIQVFQNEFRQIIEHIYEMREMGEVWVATMGEIASYCEARENISLQVQRSKENLKIFMENNLNTGKYGEPEITIIVPFGRPHKNILMRRKDYVESLKPEKIIGNNDKRKLVVNVPITTDLITICY